MEKKGDSKEREKKAKYLSDVATIEGAGSKLINHYKSEEGFYDSNLSNKEYKLLNILPENYVFWAAEKNKVLAKEIGEMNEEEVQELLKESYESIIKLLKGYVKLRESYYNIIALWIIGSYFHDDFQTFPYLFFNAMRGSGKTRALRLVITLSRDGLLMTSPTEATLFRTKGTLGIDEFEGVGSKNKDSLRELLNASYKKGNKVLRMKKKSGNFGEEMVVEEFEIYRPVVMANIWGMEEVLEDRCISLVLEKTSDKIITRIVEDFEGDVCVVSIKSSLVKCCLCSLCSKKENRGKPKNYQNWNDFIRKKYETTLTTTTTQTTQTTQTTPTYYPPFFEKIDSSGIFGRNLELFFPLFWIAEVIGEDILETTIETAKEMVKSKKKEEHTESKDVMLIDFISHYPEGIHPYPLKDLVREFARFADVSEGGREDWLNPKWMGRALKRLNLILDKTRIGSGVKITLNIVKAKEKLKIFKEEEEDEKK